MSSTPAASQHPLVVAPDAAPSPPTAEPTSGGPDSRSDPLPAPHALLTPHEDLLDVTYIHPQVPLEVMSSTPAASPHPLVVAPDAAPSPPTAEPTSGGPDSRSDPLPPLHALLTPHEDSLDVTYIHPQVPLEVMSSTPAASPQPAGRRTRMPLRRLPPPSRPLVAREMDVPTPCRPCMRFSLLMKIARRHLRPASGFLRD